MVWLALLLIGIPCLLLWDYLSKKRRNDMLHYMPGPRPLPFLGNMLIYRGIGAEHFLHVALGNCKKYGGVYRIWLFTQLIIFSADPRHAESILSSPRHITKTSAYYLLRPWLGTGLLMSTGSKWHSRRKIITPTFHFKILEQFVDIFDQQSSILVQQLLPHADGRTPIDVIPIVCLMALDIITETSMGTKIHAQKHPDLPYVQAMWQLTTLIAERFIKPWLRIEWLFRLLKPQLAKKQDELIEIMHVFTESIIRQRREALVKAQQQFQAADTDCNELGQKRRMALLDVLLQSTVNGAPLSDEDIREEVDTFIFEGHDTTTSAISFCLYEISRHADVQRRLLNEINEVLGMDRQRPIKLQDLNELKYLDCVVKESLRLYPSVPIIARTFTEDVEILGKRIPAGTDYFVGIFALQRDPRQFEAPHEFRPERFDQSNSRTAPHPYSNVPFSAGPRNCIGQKFAMLEMKCTVSKVLQHFELLPLGPQPRPVVSLILRSINGVQLGLRPRL